MLTQKRNPNHNVKAWYYAPIYIDNTTDTTASKKLTWSDNPVTFMGAYVIETKNGLSIVPNFTATSTGGKFTTESTINFDDKGKIGFGRVAPKKDKASKIQKAGIESNPTYETNSYGNRFATQVNSKVIPFG